MSLDLTQFEGHAPGPWSVSTITKDLFQDETGKVVMECFDECTELTNEATRNLIKAAPDLLAEVKKLREALAILKGGFEMSKISINVISKAAIEGIKEALK